MKKKIFWYVGRQLDLRYPDYRCGCLRQHESTSGPKVGDRIEVPNKGRFEVLHLMTGSALRVVKFVSAMDVVDKQLHPKSRGTSLFDCIDELVIECVEILPKYAED